MWHKIRSASLDRSTKSKLEINIFISPCQWSCGGVLVSQCRFDCGQGQLILSPHNTLKIEYSNTAVVLYIMFANQCVHHTSVKKMKTNMWCIFFKLDTRDFWFVRTVDTLKNLRFPVKGQGHWQIGASMPASPGLKFALQSAILSLWFL